MELIYREEAFAHNSEPKLEIFYKGRLLTKKYEPDLVAYSKIVIDLRAVKALADEHCAQLQNYLKASSFQLGLLINFGRAKSLEYERIVRTQISSKNSFDS